VLEHVVGLPRLQHLHEGQGSARRPLHHQPNLRHLRRQSLHLLGLHAEHGLQGEAAAPGRVDRQPRRSRRVHVRSQHLPRESRRRRLLRENGAGDQPRRLGESQEDGGPPRGRSRLCDHRRHHDRAQPAGRRLLPRSARHQPLHARDVLPDGRPPRTSVDALRGRRRNGGHRPALHRLSFALGALRRVHEALRAAARRPVRLLLRCFATSNTAT